MKILIINGPNLNLLGKREPTVYGRKPFEDYFEQLQIDYPDITLHYYQSNHEGKLIDKLHETGFDYQGIILNAGGYSHTSVALADAIAASIMSGGTRAARSRPATAREVILAALKCSMEASTQSWLPSLRARPQKSHSPAPPVP
mgnify:CR=1 FL=1